MIRSRVAILLLLLAIPAAALAASSADPMRPSPTIDRDPVLSALKTKIAEAGPDACLFNDLGIALARRSFFRESAGAFEASLRVEDSSVVHNNLGSLWLTLREPGKAARSFERAIRLDPNYALAHYNLGVAYSDQFESDAAIESFKRAFELDLRLADPAFNPQVVNNRYLVAVMTERYRDTAGAMTLPLQTSCAAPAGAEAAKPSAP